MGSLYGIKSDLQLVQFNTPKEFEEIELYMIADVHFGSPAFNERMWKEYKKRIKKENAYVVYAGDLMDNALKNSKSNVYEQTLSPMQQKRRLVDELSDHKDKIIAILPGNHEARTTKESDMLPIYDVACKLDIEDRYRHNMAIMDIGVGSIKSGSKQVHYFGVAMHKTNKTVRYHYADVIDGIDFYVSGHTHTPGDTPKAKIKVDPHNKIADIRPVETVVTGSFMDYMGYPMEMALRPSANKNYMLKLNGKRKSIGTEGFYL